MLDTIYMEVIAQQQNIWSEMILVSINLSKHILKIFLHVDFFEVIKRIILQRDKNALT